jgi:hypothetical protein
MNGENRGLLLRFSIPHAPAKNKLRDMGFGKVHFEKEMTFAAVVISPRVSTSNWTKSKPIKFYLSVCPVKTVDVMLTGFLFRVS